MVVKPRWFGRFVRWPISTDSFSVNGCCQSQSGNSTEVGGGRGETLVRRRWRVGGHNLERGGGFLTTLRQYPLLGLRWRAEQVVAAIGGELGLVLLAVPKDGMAARLQVVGTGKDGKVLRLLTTARRRRTWRVAILPSENRYSLMLLARSERISVGSERGIWSISSVPRCFPWFRCSSAWIGTPIWSSDGGGTGGLQNPGVGQIAPVVTQQLGGSSGFQGVGIGQGGADSGPQKEGAVGFPLARVNQNGSGTGSGPGLPAPVGGGGNVRPSMHVNPRMVGTGNNKEQQPSDSSSSAQLHELGQGMCLIQIILELSWVVLKEE